MAFSEYLGLAVANWLDRSQPFPANPTNTYLSLHSSEPAADVGDNELVGGGYARRIVTLTSVSNLPASINMTNSAPVIFPVSTADLGNITHWGLWSAAGGGDFYGFGEFDAPIQWVSGAAVVVPLNQLIMDVITDIVTITP